MTERPFAQYLNVRQAYGASFAPNGRSLAFLTDITGTPQVWTVGVEGGWPDQRTFESDRVTGVRYAPQGDRLLFSRDMGGNERTQIYLLEADGAELRALTGDPGVIHTFGAWSRDGERIAYAANARDPRYFDVYVQEVAGDAGARRVLTHDGTNYPVEFSPDGAQLLIERDLTNRDNQLLLLDLATGEARELTGGEPGALYSAAHFASDGRSLLLLCDRDRDTAALARLNIATGALTWLQEGAWEYTQLALSRDGTLLALVENRDGYGVLHVRETETRAERPIPTPPPGVILDIDWSPDGTHLALTIGGAAGNADVHLLDLRAGTLTQVTRSSTAGIPRESFVAPDLIHFPSFDGRRIPAFFYRPEGGSSPFPVVVYVHGGPESQFVPGFNAVVQYLVGRGYGVLAPNVRGSTGYGRTYTDLDNVRLRMDSVADLQHAVDRLREHGADAERIAVMGGSYGGFMTLAAITTYPDLWAAAVDIVGIANFVTFLEHTGPWRRRLREAEYGSLEHDREFLQSISPIRHVDRITAPLFVIHGANDPRVPIGEAEQIVARLRELGRPVEYLRFEDEGHGLVRLPNRIRAYTEVGAFLDRYLLPREG